MKIQIVSDCHLEFLGPDSLGTELRQHPDADVVVLAGDFGTQRLKDLGRVDHFLKYCSVPIVYVMGNHDFYYNSLSRGRDAFKRLLEKRDDVEVYVLENEFVTIGDVTFYGTPLWTDFHLPGYFHPPEVLADAVADFSAITHKRRPISWKRYLAKFKESVSFLEWALKGEHLSKPVVVTHWPPHVKSIGPQFIGDALNPYFINQLDDELIASAHMWIHGHTHGSSDYLVGDCRVLANPRGYPRGYGWENQDFDPFMLVEV